jgi:hypothetical protein
MGRGVDQYDYEPPMGEAPDVTHGVLHEGVNNMINGLIRIAENKLPNSHELVARIGKSKEDIPVKKIAAGAFTAAGLYVVYRSIHTRKKK